MSKLQEIYDGWSSFLLNKFKRLPEERRKEAEKRLSLCLDCPLRTNNRCDSRKVINNIKGCGCYIHAKAFSVNSSCPLNKF